MNWLVGGRRYRGAIAGISCAVLAACGGDDDGGQRGLDNYLPEVPAPTGESASAFAGPAQPRDLIPGPATSGMVGDFFMRNARARFVIQSAARVIGVVPQGGNLVDATLLDGDGGDLAADHFGELSAVYLVGRTCEHEVVEVVHDGSGGGAAVIRARGRSGVNDFINLKGIGLLGIPNEIDPDIDDDVECATTYVLRPDSRVLETYWTFYNADEELAVRGPFGALNDTGGETETFAPTRGFERAGIDALTSLAEPAPIDYVVYQGPGIAYGIVPRHGEQEAVNSALVIAGVSIVLYGVDAFLDILRPDGWSFELPPLEGVTQRVDVVVGRDAADVEEHFQAGRGVATVALEGRVAYASGAAAAGARVGLFLDADGDGELGDDDPVVSYMAPDDTGAFAGRFAPGNYLIRAEVKDVARSALAPAPLSSDLGDVTLELPDPVVYDYRIIDDETGASIPGRLTVVGQHPVFPDSAVFETYDRIEGVVKVIPSAYGTSVDVGDGADPALALAPGVAYRVYASRGTEWSVATLDLEPQLGEQGGELELRLRQVAPTPGYLSTEFHQHSVGSPDSPVGRSMRAKTFVAEGIEFFASTDHDYVTDFQPLIEALGLDRVVRAVPGIEVTPFVYGHFQAFPLEVDDGDPSRGAIDWARGLDGLALIPSEIWEVARQRGAEVIQINHPRVAAGGFSDMMQYFDRAGLEFDYDARVISGDPLRAQVPYEWLRLPEASIWSDAFEALEVWNGFGMKDSNRDGVREIGSLDLVMRDWFNFLSFGLAITPMGNSDSHEVVRSAVGMPRTLVRVTDDSAGALAAGLVTDEVLDTLAGRLGAPKDVVLTNGPHVEVGVAGAEGSVLGATVDAGGGSVTLTLRITAPTWAAFDTVELFVNATPDVGEKRETWLQPAMCFTSRALASLPEAEPCVSAALAPRSLVVERVEVAPGFERLEAALEVELAAADVPLWTREGADGSDAWVAVRVRGQQAVFPLIANGAVSDANLATLTSGAPDEVEAALLGIGVPASAVTSPVFIDFDGGGYRAPFAP